MNAEVKASLYFSDLATGGHSDKEYHAQIVKSGSGFLVNFQFGRRGGTLQTGTKTPEPVSYEEASVIFERVTNEKVRKGYIGATPKDAAPEPLPAGASNSRTRFPVEELMPIEEGAVDAYIKSPAYIMQVKHDGERRQIERTAKGFIGYNKLGNIASIPAGIVKELRENADAQTFVIDGELIGDTYRAFDLLECGGNRTADLPYGKRHAMLEDVLRDCTLGISVSPMWRSARQKRIGFQALKDTNAEGAVFKKLDASYRPGRNWQQVKLKFWKMGTFRVVGLRAKGHESVTLGLLDGKGRWTEVGRASIIGKGEFAIGDLVEVKFLNATAGKRLYQPEILRKRDDVRESECTIEQQLRGKYKQGIAA